MKRRDMLGATLALTTARASSATASEAGRLQRLTIATGSKGTAYQLIGQELAACVRELHPGCDVQVLVTAGGVNNMNLMREGHVDIAFVNASVAWAASLGILEFQGGSVPLRAAFLKSVMLPLHHLSLIVSGKLLRVMTSPAP